MSALSRFAVVSVLAALVAFAAFYALGRATAGTTSDLAQATPLVVAAHTGPHVPLLGRVAALPAAPARKHVTHAAPPPAVVTVAAPVPTAPPAPKPRPGARVLSGVSAGARAAYPSNLGCARWASSNGSDSGSGSRSSPFRTVTRLALALRPGQTGCLVAGSTFDETVKIWHAGRRERPIKIQTQGSPRALIRGPVEVSWRSHDLVLAALRVQGPVSVHGVRVSLVRDDISAGGMPCVDLNQAGAAVLDGDQIHNCATAGIFVRHAKGVVIRNSTVYATSGDGIALGRGARRTRISRNVVDGNASGIVLRGTNNTVRNNIVSNSGRYNVHIGWPLAGGNVVARNCLWNGAVQATRLRLVANVTADPRYTARPYGVGPGPCFHKRPASYAFSRTYLGTPWPRLHGITVRYSVLTRRGHVQFARLSFAGLDPRAHVVVSCRHGCSSSASVPVTAIGTGDAAELTGLWIPVGATIEVRANRSGWVGAYARVLVTGGRRGVTVSHACVAPAGWSPVSCGTFEGAR
jgi:parallel beta-helix repeat protein